jgi:transposase
MFTKEQLYEMYIIKKMTATTISRLANKVPQTIINWLNNYNIPIRQGREAQIPIEPTKEQLVELYVAQLKSIDQTAKELRSSEITISRLLSQFNIPIRPKAWKCAGHNRGKQISSEQRQILSNFAKQRIGSKHPLFGTHLTKETKQKISKSLNGRFRGNLNPQWKPNAVHKWRTIIHSQFEYKEWRKKVFHRDGYTCMTCLKPSSGDIQAHHIFPVETNPNLVFDPNNGITLCRKCHSSIRGKEHLFIDTFQEIIKSRPPIQ